jgi:hypothetical protein
MYALWRAQILAMFAVFVVAGVLMVVAIAAGSGPPVWFAAFWLAALVWNSYWFLFRIAYQLDLTERELYWRTPFRNGSIALTDLVELRPHRFGSSIEVIQLADGAKILVMVRKGFVEFMAENPTSRPTGPRPCRPLGEARQSPTWTAGISSARVIASPTRY